MEVRVLSWAPNFSKANADALAFVFVGTVFDGREHAAILLCVRAFARRNNDAGANFS
ncbi:hypothetical protein AABB87_14225 [Roseateles sp. PN1]